MGEACRTRLRDIMFEDADVPVVVTVVESIQFFLGVWRGDLGWINWI